MKKILSTILFITIPLFVRGQLSGSGTFASPYKGTLNQDVTWSSNVYINGDILTSAYKLTIDPGVKVIFVTDTADIKIRGTGQLIADGTSASMIRFTADDDNDSNYGETGERWGHISFESMGSAGASLIDNCIIEWGDVNGTSLPNRYGGGIHTSFTNLTISNCIIRNNKAGWGGGIFVNKNASPAITNCNIHNNSSSSSGGGLYIWSNSASLVTNCLIFSNTSTAGGGGGGIFLGDLCGNVRIFNSTIVNNSAVAAGKNIHLYINTNPSRPSFINCIIWNPANSIVYTNQTPSTNDFINCAIQNPISGSTTNCISLNASNTDPAGPNFTATDGSDWSIKYVSPCRDAGTTPSPTVPYDFIGNPRILSYDIGAYEVQYSRWKTTASTTDWGTAGNWDGGVPTDTRDVIIPTGATNYPTGSPAQDFTIGTGKFMIMDPGSRLTLDDLTNNGLLKLNATSSGFASLIINSYTRGGGATEEIQLFLTGGGSELLEDYKWHYISTPVTSLSTNTFTGATLDLAQFVESRPVLSLLQGWVAFDGYVYSTGVSNGPTFNTLTPGKGYDFWDYTDNTFTFGGLFNTSNVTMPLGYSGVPSRHGFNLLGNPFASGLNWNDIINSVYFPYPANTSKGVYFTSDNLQCTYIGGVGIPGDVDGIIPPMQGFFTKTYSTGNSITLPAAARTNTGIHARYKGTAEIIPLVRLQLSQNTTYCDETVVRFDSEAKSYLDNDFDAVKMFIAPTRNQIYSSLDGIEYAINGLPFPVYPDTVVNIPVVINVTAAGSYNISMIQFQALANYDVVLEDKTTGISTNLKRTPTLAFSSEAGTFSDRFILKIGDILTVIEDIVNPVKNFTIYQYDNFINVVPLGEEWSNKTGSVNVIDFTGRSVGNVENVGFQKDAIIQVAAPGVKGMYIVEIRSGMKRYVGKVVIR